MTVRVYRSDDASAPVLSGTAGALIAVLDACLVNGYTGKPASGWAKEFSGTNLATYRAPTGNRMYLRVDDTNTLEARIVGYETMSDVNTGTGPFPTTAQVSGGLYLRKSTTSDAVARPWIMVVTQTCFYFFPNSGDTVITVGTASGASGHTFFGDFISYKPGDAYNSMIICSSNTGTNNGMLGIKIGSMSSFITATGHFIARGYTQAGTASTANMGVAGDYASAAVFGASSGPIYPDPIAGGIPLGVIEIIEPTATWAVRGRLPGAWAPLILLPGAHLDTFTGSGELAGKTFTLFNAPNASSQGRLAIETSDTW